MLTSAKNEAVEFRDEREIYRCTRKRHASGKGSPPSQPSQLLRLHSLRSADIHNTPSNLCGSAEERGVLSPLRHPGAPQNKTKGTFIQLLIIVSQNFPVHGISQVQTLLFSFVTQKPLFWQPLHQQLS